jgi:hypothetical protein
MTLNTLCVETLRHVSTNKRNIGEAWEAGGKKNEELRVKNPFYHSWRWLISHTLAIKG